MPLKNILGADHVVITVRDLDAAAAQWKQLGFTVSPRGTHSPQMGSANYTIMFGEDYLELLGVLHDTEHNKPTRDYLARREGIERTAFTTDDAAAGVADLKARGLVPLGPTHFGRPVDLPNGGKTEAKFNVFRWPLNESPGGMRIFACQHLTREAVWIAELQQHANGAARIARIEILSPDPQAAAAHMGRLIDQPVATSHDAFRVPSGGKRADFLFYNQAGFAQRYPDAIRKGAPGDGVAALAIGTANVAIAAKALGSLGVKHDGAISVPAALANGVIVSFVP
jgi:catechol 2,3-dioxygenase-like lactoylglutathione lyase family enzyme